MSILLPSECYPYQKCELRGAMALLYNQLVTGKSLGGELLIEGRAGTGKSTGVLDYLVQACYTWPGCKVLICRETRTSLTESVMATLEDEVLGNDHPACHGSQRENRTHYDLGASKIVCGGLDKPERLFSTAWDIIYLSEAIESNEDKWELFGRAQRPRRKGLTTAPFRQRIADTNPGNPGHWLNKRASPASDNIRIAGTKEQYKALQVYNATSRASPMRRLITCHQDNPGYWDFDRWTWTPDGLEMLAGLTPMKGHNRARMLEGRWVAAEGAVFPEFDTKVHVVPDFDPPSDWPWYVGWDPGFRVQCGIVWITVAPNGDMFVGDEQYDKEEAVSVHVERVKRRLKGRRVVKWYGDPHEFFSDRQQGRSVHTQVKALGLPHFFQWANQNKPAMINVVREALARSAKQPEPKSPGLYVMERCVNTIMEFQTWAYNKKADGSVPDENKDSAYMQGNDHLLDGIIGMISTGKLTYKA